jgi:hypothetical protein
MIRDDVLFIRGSKSLAASEHIKTVVHNMENVRLQLTNSHLDALSPTEDFNRQHLLRRYTIRWRQRNKCTAVCEDPALGPYESGAMNVSTADDKVWVTGPRMVAEAVVGHVATAVLLQLEMPCLIRRKLLINDADCIYALETRYGVGIEIGVQNLELMEAHVTVAILAPDKTTALATERHLTALAEEFVTMKISLAESKLMTVLPQIPNIVGQRHVGYSVKACPSSDRKSCASDELLHTVTFVGFPGAVEEVIYIINTALTD